MAPKIIYRRVYDSLNMCVKNNFDYASSLRENIFWKKKVSVQNTLTKEFFRSNLVTYGTERMHAMLRIIESF